jgi:hypothetical protein
MCVTAAGVHARALKGQDHGSCGALVTVSGLSAARLRLPLHDQTSYRL